MESAPTSLTMSQLAELTHVHPSTIKYYISLGIVPRGRLLASNRALYDASHVERIRLIRTLVTVGGVSIASVQDIVAALDTASLTQVLSAVQSSAHDDHGDPQGDDATVAFVRERFGLDDGSPLFHHPSVTRLAAAIDAARPELGERFDAWLEALLPAGRAAAQADLDLVRAADTFETAGRYAAVGIPLGDVVLAHARRLWQSVLTSAAYGDGPVHVVKEHVANEQVVTGRAVKERRSEL